MCVLWVCLYCVLQFQVLDDKEPTEELWDAGRARSRRTFCRDSSASEHKTTKMKENACRNMKGILNANDFIMDSTGSLKRSSN